MVGCSTVIESSDVGSERRAGPVWRHAPAVGRYDAHGDRTAPSEVSEPDSRHRAPVWRRLAWSLSRRRKHSARSG